MLNQEAHWSIAEAKREETDDMLEYDFPVTYKRSGGLLTAKMGNGYEYTVLVGKQKETADRGGWSYEMNGNTTFAYTLRNLKAMFAEDVRSEYRNYEREVRSIQ